MNSLVIKDVNQNHWSKQLFSIAFGSVLLAIFAHVKIFLPFTPVPFVAQNLIAILLGIVLGPRNGFLSVLAFIFQGLCGLPVFSGANVGLAFFLSPTAGYLIGYAASAYFAGFFAKDKTLKGLLIAMTFGLLIQYFFGVGYLAQFVGMSKAFVLGCVPFIVVDAIKIAVGYSILKKVYFS
jgi:biotin transport system substrate-specific component